MPPPVITATRPSTLKRLVASMDDIIAGCQTITSCCESDDEKDRDLSKSEMSVRAYMYCEIGRDLSTPLFSVVM